MRNSDISRIISNARKQVVKKKKRMPYEMSEFNFLNGMLAGIRLVRDKLELRKRRKYDRIKQVIC